MSYEKTLCVKTYHSEFSSVTTGVMTYWNDFQNIILPELCKHYKLIDNPDFAKNILLFHEHRRRVIRGRHVIQILHTPLKGQLRKLSKRRKYITHYHIIAKIAPLYGIRAHYIPMSIDIKKLPQSEKKKGIVYYGNLFSEKRAIFEKLMKSGVDFDTISFKKLNDGDYQYSHEECLKLVSQYEYGIGVGRAAQEMMAMGLKVIIAGRNYSGAVTNRNLPIHLSSNCNSNILQKDVRDFENDLKQAEVITNKHLLDMRNYVKNYLQVIGE